MSVQTDEALGTAAENFSVAKFSRNFGRSRIGALFINKTDIDAFGDLAADTSYFNRTYAVDAVFAPHPNFTIQGFVSGTQTSGLTAPVDDPATPAREDEGWGGMGSYINAEWLDTNWRIYGEYADFENDFNPEVGFLPRRGIRRPSGISNGTRDLISGGSVSCLQWSTTSTRPTRPDFVSRTDGTTCLASGSTMAHSSICG